MTHFHLWRTQKQIYHYITHIDWCCTNIFHIQLFSKKIRGSFRLKKSQVDFREGGQPISIKSQVQKSPNPARGGVISTWDEFPSFVAFSIGKLPLFYHLFPASFFSSLFDCLSFSLFVYLFICLFVCSVSFLFIYFHFYLFGFFLFVSCLCPFFFICFCLVFWSFVYFIFIFSLFIWLFDYLYL